MGSLPNICIAVVDDDESLRRSMSRLLRGAALEVIAYPSAEAFLADLGHPHFDCLLLDIQLGGMSGIELRDRLAAQGADTPVIFISAHDEPEVRAQALAGRCAGYFRKTAAGTTIVDAIRDADRMTASRPSTKSRRTPLTPL